MVDLPDAFAAFAAGLTDGGVGDVGVAVVGGVALSPPTPPTPPTEDLSICHQGPCRYFIKTESPVPGSVVPVPGRPGEVTTLNASQCFCRAGVQLLSEGTQAKGVAKALELQYILPVACNQWDPWSDEEIVNLEERRAAAQDRVAQHLEAQALRDADTEGPIPPEMILDPGAEIPDLPSPELPANFDAITNKGDQNG